MKYKIDSIKSSKKTLAAIDIGSNAIRFLAAKSEHSGQLKTAKKVRGAIRLGTDVFQKGYISAKTESKALKIFKKFKNYINALEVQSYRAVATSAVRDSLNGESFLRRLQLASGLRVQLISGVEEANLIHKAVTSKIKLYNVSALLIDIGGGSTEVTHSLNAKIKASTSLKLGTVRILERLKRKKLKEKHLNILMGKSIPQIHDFLDRKIGHEKLDYAIGTGGNIEALGRLKVQILKKATKHHLTLDELVEITKKLQKMTLNQRIKKLGLRPDRADVIVPAALILQTLLRHSEVSKILIPYVGLRDGLLLEMKEQCHQVYIRKQISNARLGLLRNEITNLQPFITKRVVI